MTGPKLNSKQVTTIRHMWIDGKSASEIANAMGITRHGVYYHVRGFPRTAEPQRKPATHLTPCQKREAVERFKRGESNGSIARDYGVTDQTISCYTWRFHRRRATKRRIMSAVLFPNLRIWMEERGETPRSLALGMGTSTSNIYAILRGERRPSAYMRHKLTHYTGMDEATIFATDQGGIRNEDDI